MHVRLSTQLPFHQLLFVPLEMIHQYPHNCGRNLKEYPHKENHIHYYFNQNYPSS